MIARTNTARKNPLQLNPMTSHWPSRGLLQRQCACGGTPGPTGECGACQKKRLQRAAAEPSSARAHSSGAPSIVHEVLRSPGQPLDSATRASMDQRFGYDFSSVRVHSGAAAERSAQEVNAKAYTVGHNLVFGAAQFAPGTHGGRRLLAHELAHVVQQRASAPSGDISIGSPDSPEEAEADRAADQVVTATGQAEPIVTTAAAPMLRAKPKKTPAPQKAKPKKIPQICGRNSRKVPGNSITKVNLDVGAHTLTIEWQDQTKVPSGSAGTHDISPGTGLCCVDCNDVEVSKTQDTLCTPKGGSWPVDSVGCILSARHPGAKNATFFQRPTIAIHSGNVSSPPQSHGCARTPVEISELIHDNVVPGTTQIASSGTWKSSNCYKTVKTDILSKRADVCDGNKLKSKKKAATPAQKPKQHFIPNVPTDLPREETPKPNPSIPVAEALTRENDGPSALAELEPAVEALPGMTGDGPGPNNDPPSHENIDEPLMSDLDLQDDADKEEEASMA